MFTFFFYECKFYDAVYLIELFSHIVYNNQIYIHFCTSLFNLSEKCGQVSTSICTTKNISNIEYTSVKTNIGNSLLMWSDSESLCWLIQCLFCQGLCQPYTIIDCCTC